jgi:hypothetical protein
VADLTRRRGLAMFLGIALLVVVTAGVWLLVFARTAPSSGGAAGTGTTPGAAAPTSGPATGPSASPGTPATSVSAQPTVHSSPPTHVAAFLGDGSVQGLTGGDAVAGRWTTTLSREQGWTEDNFGRAGTGYAATPDDPATCWMASCPAVPDMVAEAVAAKPNVVVVSAGAADLTLLAQDRNAVHRAVNRTYRTLAAQLPGSRVLALSPLWTGPGDPPPALATLDAWVKSAARKYDADYVPGGATWLAQTPNATVDGDLSTDGHARVAAVLHRWLTRHS